MTRTPSLPLDLPLRPDLCIVTLPRFVRDDLLGECVDKVEIGFDAYLTGTNGNPLTYDTVRLWTSTVFKLCARF